MPINVEIVVHGVNNGAPILSRDIVPGEFASFSNLQNDDPHFLVAECNPEDDGGFVERYGLEDALELPGGGPRTFLDTAKGTPLAMIGPEGHHFQRLTTRHGLGTLMLRHYHPYPVILQDHDHEVIARILFRTARR